MSYAVEMVHVKVRTLAKIEQSGVKLGTCTLVSETSADRQIVLEGIEHRRTHLKRVGVTVEVFQYEESIIVGMFLSIADAHACNPLPLGDEFELLYASLKYRDGVSGCRGRSSVCRLHRHRRLLPYGKRRNPRHGSQSHDSAA